MFLCIGATLFFIPVILVVQSVQPYHRVFTFLGVILALFFFAVISQWIKGKGTWIVGVACLILCGWQLSSEYYNAPYASREVEIKEIWEQSGIDECPQSICFMDDYQKYVLQFYWDYRPMEAWQEEAQYILMPKEVMNPEYKAKVWPILYTYEEVNWEALKECSVVAETESYVLYTR